ncbi:hypothetical protein ACLQ26_06590 [Micromonospora sp. DT43]
MTDPTAVAQLACGGTPDADAATRALDRWQLSNSTRRAPPC